MSQQSDSLLDAAAHLILEDDFGAVNVARVASYAGVSEDAVLEEFGSLDTLLVAMLNREFARIWRSIADHVERDPRGGLLSHIYRYTLAGVYERPLARALFLTDRDALNRIMRASHSFRYIPDFGVRAVFIERMKEAGMVRPEVDAEQLSAVLTAVSAGAALNAPHAELDLVIEGLAALLAEAVDADVDDTTPGKTTFFEYARTLARAPRRE